MKFQREKHNKQQNQIEGTFTKTPNKYHWFQLFRLEFCRWHQNSENQPAFSQLEMSAVAKIALVSSIDFSAALAQQLRFQTLDL